MAIWSWGITMSGAGAGSTEKPGASFSELLPVVRVLRPVDFGFSVVVTVFLRVELGEVVLEEGFLVAKWVTPYKQMLCPVFVASTPFLCYFHC